jgi:hypothetical protein
VYAGVFGEGEHAELVVPAKRGAWVHVARGKVRVNGTDLGEGDGAAIEGESIRIDGIDSGEVLAFDLA